MSVQCHGAYILLQSQPNASMPNPRPIINFRCKRIDPLWKNNGRFIQLKCVTIVCIYCEDKKNRRQAT